MKSIIRRLLSILPDSLRDRLRSFVHQRNWVRRFKGIHEVYFKDYQTRGFLIDLLQRHVPGDGEISIFEFGCSGGNNLRLLRERLGRPVRFTGVDISPDAISFAEDTFPGDSFHAGGGEVAISLLTGNPHDVFLVSGVLSYIPEEPCRAILGAAAKSCRYLLLCDLLDRIDEESGLEDGLFHHPFLRLFRETGWEMVGGIELSTTGHAYSSLFARSTLAAPVDATEA